MDALKSAAHSAANKFEEGFHSIFTNITGSEEHEAARLKSQQQSDANFDQARMQARSKMISTSDSPPVVMEKAGKKILLFPGLLGDFFAFVLFCSE